MAEQQKTPQAAAAQTQTITIDGNEYSTADLSEEARAQVVNLRVTDQEINRLKQQLAIYQTARASYAKALGEELPKQKH